MDTTEEIASALAMLATARKLREQAGDGFASMAHTFVTNMPLAGSPAQFQTLEKQLSALLLHVAVVAVSGYAGSVVSLPAATSTRVSLATVVEATAKWFGFEVGDLLGRARLARKAYARHVAMFLCRKHLHSSLHELGEFFGRDHSTCMQALTRIEALLATHDDTRVDIEGIEGALMPTVLREQERAVEESMSDTLAVRMRLSDLFYDWTPAGQRFGGADIGPRELPTFDQLLAAATEFVESVDEPELPRGNP